jgi:hypothetical protein
VRKCALRAWLRSGASTPAIATAAAFPANPLTLLALTFMKGRGAPPGARFAISLPREGTMTSTDRHPDDTLEILIGELMADEELRDAFLRDPDRTLQRASDWALPLSDSEVRALRRAAHRIWDTVAEALEARWPVAA